MSHELRLLQQANRRAREAGEEATRLARIIEERERAGWCAAQGAIAELQHTVARTRCDARWKERHRAARDLAAHDRDRRIARAAARY